MVQGQPYNWNGHVEMTYNFFLQRTPYKLVPRSLEFKKDYYHSL